MAITYKSQGAGVTTEASGGALSPLCPATVDAGDILIAHTGWEGTTNGPSTPGGWTLLSGPHTIESAHRHWIFGKIADGTEDGAAVAFGSPAVTTMRTARVYSFAGRTSGSIADLVNGFAHLSHATDPQMPTVTTTKAGGLAVACVFQTDDNATASATGESGGDWVEAVAEYIQSATTPDSALSIQTCTPTTDPGTVTGGTISTLNDPCGVIGFQIIADANQVVSADVGALTVTGFAPTVTASDNQTVVSGVGALVVTGFAPTATVSDPITAAPGTGVVDAVGFSPTISVSDNQTAAPDVGVLTATGLAPTVDITAGAGATPGTGDLVATGFAPTATASDHQTVTPGAGVLTASGFVPIVTASDHQTVVPDVGSLTLNGLPPAVQTPVTLITDLGQITLTGFAPEVSVSAGASPGTGQLIVAGLAPTVTTSNNQLVTPDLGSLVASGLAPTASTTDNIVVRPGTGSLDATGLVPTILGTEVQRPDTGGCYLTHHMQEEVIALTLLTIDD